MRLVIATTVMWLVAGPTGAQHPDIDHEVERLVPQITEIRHQIHAHPELGNREVATAALVAALRARDQKLGLSVDVERVA